MFIDKNTIVEVSKEEYEKVKNGFGQKFLKEDYYNENNTYIYRNENYPFVCGKREDRIFFIFKKTKYFANFYLKLQYC